MNSPSGHRDGARVRETGVRPKCQKSVYNAASKGEAIAVSIAVRRYLGVQQRGLAVRSDRKLSWSVNEPLNRRNLHLHDKEP
jgi:hypothetical protein